MKIGRVFALWALGCVLAAPALAAQVSTGTTGTAADELRGERSARQRDVPQGSATLLDRPVSRATYRLGPGDVLGVSLFGQISEQYSVPVTPEGTVVVPTIGVARVLGLNLDDAEARVRALVGRYYRDIEVRVTLVEVRSFKVFLVGNVQERGVRVANAATRVSELLPSSEASGATSRQGVQRRNIRLRRANGDSLVLDMARFLQTGDTRDNPTLLEGDAIVIPVLDATVEVFGKVAFPGRYEYRPGESLADFLVVANGASDFPASASDTVRVARFNEAGVREFITLSRADAAGARGKAFPLRPSDAIFLPEVGNFRVQRTATIEGRVRFPGTYPIRQDTTTVRDLVELAGGFLPDASLQNATLQRVIPTLGGVRELFAAPDSALTAREREIRTLSSQGQGGVYVVVDFQRLFAEGGEVYNQPLRANDLLTVPMARNEVVVLGAVLRPGVVVHTPGASYQHYIALAGGFSRRADRDDISVVRGAGGNRVDVRDAYYPAAGDQIVIPFRERHTLAERAQIVGAITSAILSVVAVVRL